MWTSGPAWGVGTLGVGSVMVEGGATLITGFFRAGLVDRLAVCLAPKILGNGIQAIGDLGIRDLSRSLILADATVEPTGWTYPERTRRIPRWHPGSAVN